MTRPNLLKFSARGRARAAWCRANGVTSSSWGHLLCETTAVQLATASHASKKKVHRERGRKESRENGTPCVSWLVTEDPGPGPVSRGPRPWRASRQGGGQLTERMPRPFEPRGRGPWGEETHPQQVPEHIRGETLNTQTDLEAHCLAREGENVLRRCGVDLPQRALSTPQTRYV